MPAIAVSSERGEESLTEPAVHSRRRRVRTQRSLAAILTGLMAFAVLQLGLAVVIEIDLPEVHDALYGRRLRFVQKSLRAEPAKPWTVLMLGTSRTLQGFRPGAVEKNWGEPAGRRIAAFNFGVNAGSPMTELLTWRRLRRDGVRPDLLLVEVMPPLLCSQINYGDMLPDNWTTPRLRWGDLALVKRYAGSFRPGLRRDWLTASALPCYFQRYSLEKLVAPDLAPKMPYMDYEWNVDEFGGLKTLKAPTPKERRRLTEVAREAYGQNLNGFRLGGRMCEALRELMESCRKEDVPAALVLMPEGPAFRSWYAPETLRDVQQWVAQLGRENAAPVIDAREWIEEDDFNESNHLLPSGAEKFSDRIGREYILPLLRRQSHEVKPPRALAVRPSPF